MTLGDYHQKKNPWRLMTMCNLAQKILHLLLLKMYLLRLRLSWVDVPPNKVLKLEQVPDIWLDDILFTNEEPIDETSARNLEVERYFTESADKTADPISWWKARQLLYPNLAKLAKKCLGVPASSVPAERIFSLAGNLVTKKRVQLSAENINLLIFLNKNA